MKRKLFTASLPTFLDFILIIVALSAKKQMLRVLTGRVVAFMENVDPRRNRSMMDLPGQAVSVKNCSHSILAEIQPPITTMALADPQPTMRGFFNLVPKSIDEDRWKGYACSRFDVVTHIVSVVPASYREAVATLLASPYLTTKTSQISMVGHPMFTFHS